MKLLLISDSLSVVSIFETREDKYYYNSIQVDYLFIQDENAVSRIFEILQTTKYHLILSIVHGVFKGDYVKTDSWVNSINNYGSEEVIQHCSTQFGENKTLHTTSIVNKSTAYFNVFLDIQKGVSLSAEVGETIALGRLDVSNQLNYYIAYLAAQSHHQYYLLNYAENLDKIRVAELLEKID
jgi:hypothetical protein